MFNIRVYGILRDHANRILVSEEMIRGRKVIKFPGGGLEKGEGIADCLKREFMEELNLPVNILQHYYTTDFYQESAFKTGDQVISIYYEVESLEMISIPWHENAGRPFYCREDDAEKFYWIDAREFSEASVTLPIDKVVAKMITDEVPLFFRKEHRLENERVILEPLKTFHYEKLLPVALHKELWQFTGAKINSEEDFKKYFETALQEKRKFLAYPFAVFDKRSGKYAGSTRYANISFHDKRMEIGWTWYHPGLQGSGINIACKFLLLEYAFEVIQLNRVEQKTSVFNLRSQAAMTKLGATKEGTLRRHITNEDGTVRDTVYFSYIAEEWPAIRSEIFQKFYQP